VAMDIVPAVWPSHECAASLERVVPITRSRASAQRVERVQGKALAGRFGGVVPSGLQNIGGDPSQFRPFRLGQRHVSGQWLAA